MENIFIVYHLFLHFSLPSSKFPIPAGRGWSWEPGSGSISAKSNPKCKILQLYIFRFSTVELLWSERNSPDRLLQCCTHTEGIHTKVGSCSSRHVSGVYKLSLPCNDTFLVLSHYLTLLHTYNTHRQTGCIFLYHDVVKESRGSSFWTFDIVSNIAFTGLVVSCHEPGTRATGGHLKWKYSEIVPASFQFV